MTHEQLNKAYLSVCFGNTYPLLIGLNPAFREWYARLIMDGYMRQPAYRADAEVARRMHIEVERIRQQQWGWFKSGLMVFRD